MPFQSDAQRRLFYAAAEGRAKGGPSPEVAKKFIRDSKGERKRRAKKIVDRSGSG